MRDGDVGHEQAGDRLVDAAAGAHEPDQTDPQCADRAAGNRHHDVHANAAAAPATSGAIAAAARPPSTTAPSPPMTTSPSCAGSATHSAVRSRGAARCSVFCSENALPKAPRQTSAKKSPGDLSEADQKQRERRRRNEKREQRNERALKPLAQPIACDRGRSPPRARLRVSSRGSEMLVTPLRERADHALDEIIHLLKLDRGLRVGLACARDLICPCCP